MLAVDMRHGMEDRVTAPVEYAVAVDAYLGQAPLSAASRRVYRISLAGWAWPLVGQPIPGGARRRGAAPPVVPLALLDDPGTAGLLAQAFAGRAAGADARTANRELSALRGAVGWWQDLGWIRTDPTAGLRHRPPAGLAAPLGAEQAGALFRLPASLREQAFWRLLYDSGAPAAAVLALGASQLDLDGHRVRRMPGGGVAAASAGIAWATGRAVPALAAGGADLGAGVRHRPAGGRPDRTGQHRRRLPADRAGAAVLPSGGGDLHRRDAAAGPGGRRLDPASAQRCAVRALRSAGPAGEDRVLMTRAGRRSVAVNRYLSRLGFSARPEPTVASPADSRSCSVPQNKRAYTTLRYVFAGPAPPAAKPDGRTQLRLTFRPGPSTAGRVSPRRRGPGTPGRAPAPSRASACPARRSRRRSVPARSAGRS